MEEESMKGTVTSIASLYPVEEAQKAAKRVEESIIEKKKELDRINTFVTENTNLVNLVQRLPDELSHNIMVPFGKAAFFPGRLIHTNEFYVLLGEGYYAERTSKQTTEILQRRGKFLDSQVDSLKAMMLDLKAEASFFGDTATESAEGLVEIREDYIEEDFTGITPNRSGSPKSDMLSSSEESIKKIDAEDEEYACIMSRLDELEKEELGAESADESDEVCDTKADLECSTSLHKFDHNLKISEVQLPRHPLQHGPKDESLHEKHLFNMEKPNLTEKKPSTHPQAEVKVPVLPTSNSQAFTGSIIEHTHGLRTSPSGKKSASSQSTESNPTKPVSRFKMQKGGRGY